MNWTLDCNGDVRIEKRLENDDIRQKCGKWLKEKDIVSMQIFFSSVSYDDEVHGIQKKTRQG